MNVYKKTVALIALISIFLSFPSWANNDASISEKILVEENGFKITYKDALVIVDDMTPDQLRRLAVNKSKLDKLLLQLLAHKKKVNEALKLGLDKHDDVQKRIEFATDNILVTALAKDALSKLDLSSQNYEDVAKMYYQAHPEKYQVDPRVHAAHILFRVKKGDDGEAKKGKSELANEILKKIKDGYEFELAVKENSDEKASANMGGDLGFFGYGQMVPEFEKAAFALKNVGDISDVVKTQFGFHIIKLLDKIPASTKPFSLVKADLMQAEEAKHKKYEIETFLKSFNATDKATLDDLGVKKFQKTLSDMAAAEVKL